MIFKSRRSTKRSTSLQCPKRIDVIAVRPRNVAMLIVVPIPIFIPVPMPRMRMSTSKTVHHGNLNNHAVTLFEME